MRQALIAHIHGNLVALQTVLKHCEAWRVDEVGCLGDTIGFGPDGLECLDLVRANCAWTLCGWLEFVIVTMDFRSLNNSLKSCLQRELKLLEPSALSGPTQRQRWKWLQELKSSRRDKEVLYVFGSPRDPVAEHLLQEEFSPKFHSAKAEAAFRGNFDVCFFANTHRPGAVTRERGWLNPSEIPDGNWVLDDNVKTLVNVGSVGQPRDRDPRSCYVIWDDKQRAVSFHRVAYDLKAARARFDRVPELPERYFARLEQGI
jgi:diadenosine tetraphosphatase ApaH/serine/threonine PP2A family protein phosphatase